MRMSMLGRGSAPDTKRSPQSLPPSTGRNAARAGKIEIASQAIATVAGRAVAECYGVVGVAARHPRLGTVEILPPERYAHGVVVRSARGEVSLDVNVVWSLGLRVSEIAHNIMRNVRFAVERTLGQPVVRVNVNVQALRVSSEE